MIESKKEKKDYGYDLWKTLSQINNKNFHYLRDTEERDKILQSLFVIQRWISNPKNMRKEDVIFHIRALNNIVNKNFMALHENYLGENNHRELIWLLMCILGNKNTRYGWISPPHKEKKDEYMEFFSNLREEEIRLIMNNEEIMEKIREHIQK